MPNKNFFSGLNRFTPNWLSSLCNDVDFMEYQDYQYYMDDFNDYTDYISDYTDFLGIIRIICDFFCMKYYPYNHKKSV